MPIVRIEGYRSFEVGEGSILLEGCEAADVPMESACGGFAACNSCRITVLLGAQNLSDVLEEEAAFLDSDDQRLGCQVEILGDVVLRLDPGM